ncbi:MAG TPA: D-alanyl-D-alanine carboxypeptidase, partial [Pyrinomonadaceae bacterium]|nr:D-alanyl-D-alanine carboxypeptidase [Pyrinomonadaceae bacterium]
MFRRFIILLLVASCTATLHLSSISAQDQQRPRTVVPADPSASSRPVQPDGAPPGSRSQPLLNLAPATLADLKSRIEEIAHQPALEPGFFAVKIVSLETNQIIYEQNANKFVRPASN